MNSLLDTMCTCLTENEDVPIEEVRSSWKNIRQEHRKAVDALSSLKSDSMGGKAARLDIVNIVSRVERSAYNLVRLASLWHHALHNENLILDSK